MGKHYLLLSLLAISLLAGCGALGGGEPTPEPFARYTAQQVLDALTGAGLSVQNPQRDMTVGRETPSGFSDRYTFEIAIRDIAPQGGQVLIFPSADALGEWERYIDRLRSSSATRRDVVYTFVNRNAMLQVNANLTNAEAEAYREAFMALP